MDKELVSIIIPTYNRVNLISETLDSVLTQTYSNWECIIVDDGSTDNTAEVVREYVKKDVRFQYHHRPDYHKPGGNGARNYGFELSKGDFVQWLDSDDLLKKSCLEVRVSFLCHEKDLDFAVFSMGLYKSGIKIVDDKRTVVNKSNEETLQQFLIGSKLPWNVCRPFFRRSIIEDIRFNEDLKSFQDDEYNIKILKSNPKLKYKSIDITDCFYRMDEDSIKLTNKESFSKIFSSLYEFYKSVFTLLDNQELENFRIGLFSKFYGLIKFYHNSTKNNEFIFRILHVFDNQYKLDFKTKFKIYAITYLNSFWYNKKGHYRLTKLIDKL